MEKGFVEKQKGEEKLRFEDEVGDIFRSVFMGEVDITTKAYQKIRELMLINTQEILKDALRRAIRREASMTSLELSDLLYAIQRRGQKYKVKVGKSMIPHPDSVDQSEMKYMMNYDQSGEQNEQQNQK